MEKLLMVQKIMETNQIYHWIICSIILSGISACMDISIFINILKIQSTKLIKIKIALFDIVLSTILSKIFFILNSYIETFSYIMCNLLLIVSITLCRLIIYFTINKIQLQIDTHDNLHDKHIRICICIIDIIIFSFNILITGIIDNFTYTSFILGNISILIYFYITMKYFIRIKEAEKQDIKIHILESQNKNLSTMYDNMRGFRHDFSNFVQALNGYAKTNDIEGIKVMCESITKDYKNVNGIEILGPNMFNDSAVYSILTNKYYLAQKENITMNIESMIDLSEIKKYSYEFCRILSILLDNAIEAAKECEEKVINIKFVKDAKVNRKLIIIENTYSKVDIDLDKIFEKGYSSKDDIKNEHGLGLWTVRKILRKCNNLNLFTTKGDMFRQQLEIYE